MITVGGFDDSNQNPSDPSARGPTPKFDDELYSLVPFLSAGDETITVTTQNPSDDDIIFFASFRSTLRGSAIVSSDCGNGILNTGEQCDDGNTTPGDGCSATCSCETRSTLPECVARDDPDSAGEDPDNNSDPTPSSSNSKKSSKSGRSKSNTSDDEDDSSDDDKKKSKKKKAKKLKVRRRGRY